MDLKIFDVEHGACALLTCDDNTRLIIDSGHNATTNWRPGAHLRRNSVSSIDMLAVQNYDEDHVSGLPDLCDKVDVQWLWRNREVEPERIRRWKRANGGMGPGIGRLLHEIENVYTGGSSTPQPAFQGLVRSGFHNSVADFDDSNNLSLALHLNCNGIGVMFLGDLEEGGQKKLLERSDFVAALENTSVLVAGHHGRKGGYCGELFKHCNPFYVVISDKTVMHDTQQTAADYGQHARGGSFRQEQQRKVLTTRKDGVVGFTFSPDRKWSAY